MASLGFNVLNKMCEMKATVDNHFLNNGNYKQNLSHQPWSLGHTGVNYKNVLVINSMAPWGLWLSF